MPLRRPTGSATARSGARRARAGRSLRCALVAAVAGTVLVATAAPALAVPPAPPNPTDSELGAAKSQQDAAAAEVGRIAGLVATAEAELERLGVQAEAAGTAYEVANEALQVMGGMGYSQEELVEYCQRRCRGWMIAGGSIEILKNRIAEAVFERTFPQRP